MLLRRISSPRTLLLPCLTIVLFGLTGCTKRLTEQKPVDLELYVSVPFRFVV